MSPTSSSVYLISGANRGIGLGLVKQLATRSNVIVFAGARSPSAADDLHALVQKYPGKVHILKLVSSDKDTNETAVTEIKNVSGKLDVVIANAGISQCIGPILETPAEQMHNHFDVNTVGPLILFQATYPLLKESLSPKFILVSSGAGSIEDGTQMAGLIAYGASKAAENYLARSIHFEYPDIVAFPICPGVVYTDMFDFAKTHGAPYLNDMESNTVEALESLSDIMVADGSGDDFWTVR